MSLGKVGAAFCEIWSGGDKEFMQDKLNIAPVVYHPDFAKYGIQGRSCFRGFDGLRRNDIKRCYIAFIFV